VSELDPVRILPGAEQQTIGDAVRRAASSADEYARLIEPHRAKLGNTAYRLTADRADAEDLVQETLLRAYTHLHGLKSERADLIGGWLYTIQLNLFRERFRRVDVLARPRATRICLDEGLAGDLSDPGAVSDPERQILLSQQHAAILHALAKLPGQHREVLRLCVVEEKSYLEIAERTGLPVGTVRSRISRGRKRLRGRLASWEDG
jgi:RNA polymerase sigma-70 factor (ECF subfamily)